MKKNEGWLKNLSEFISGLNSDPSVSEIFRVYEKSLLSVENTVFVITF